MYGCRQTAIRFLIALFAIFFIGSSSALADVVVCFGDSIVKGTPYVPEKEGNGRRVGGFEPRLEALLENLGRPSSVYNWGVAGENTYVGNGRIQDVLNRYDAIDFVTILEGHNDLVLFSSASVTIANLRAMVNAVREKGAKPILSTLPPDNTAQSRNQRIRNDYNPLIRSLAKEEGVLLADLYDAMAGNWGAYTSDGVHPNQTGYNIIADIYLNTMYSTLVNSTGATDVSHKSAVLNGVVRPNGFKSQYYFEYGLTADYGIKTEVKDAGSGFEDVVVTQEIEGLEKETEYHYRLVVVRPRGVLYSNDTIFTTDEEPDDSFGCFIQTIQPSKP